ncbi:wax ester/triacylglycerol synthase domain-containing protein [Micromonospora sp. NPDC006766]|uniref:wax ester/triacylglycerol synthase domain-containing protein n=1 Tax=Micromonospora sp. NPDC006766 TaxID=3154778 RepID=UPI0033D2E98E
MSATMRPEPIGRRVLVVSADIGGGHDATGRALAERVHKLWPGSQVGWIDTLDVMGPGVGHLFRRTYLTNVAATPWLYEFFWASIWRHSWFATASKWFTGAWAGRRLASVVETFDPDLIVSSYPLGSAGLAWLRRRRGLGVPIGAWICDFAPHPSWVYRDLDLDLVVHPAALPVAAVAAPGVRLGVCAPPVVDRFHPGDRIEAARRCGLDPNRAAVVVACGSYGFGHVEEAIRALVDIGDAVQVVAVCGRNEQLLAQLAALRLPPDRLLIRQWVDDMPTLLRAARLVVTNAGGATALEAWASGAPIVMYRPIAAHGMANASLMAAAGLAETARSPNALVACVRSRLVGPQAAEPPAPAAHSHLPDLGLPALADARRSTDDTRPATVTRPASWPLRSQDAFFLHVQSETVAQHIGTLLEFNPRPDGQALTATDLVALLSRRLPAIATLRRRLVVRGRWHRPGWVIDRHIDPTAHLDEVSVGPGDDGSAVLDRFWSQPLPDDRPLWRMMLISGLPDGRTRLAVKLHHCLGDGVSVIGVLDRLLDRPDRRAVGAKRPPGAPERVGVGGSEPGELVHRLRLTARGLARLATQGRAPATRFNRPARSPDRRLVTASLPASEVLRAARACRAHASELMLALTAAALAAVRPADRPPRLRAMFAVSRNPRRRAPTQGNWTGAVTLDLPLGPCAATDRVAAVRQSMRTALASGEAEAAGLVMRAMGVLPAPLHAALARRVYTNRHLNVIVSYMALPWGTRLLADAPLLAPTPVVALAEGVPLGIGVLRCRDSFEIGALMDESLADTGDEFVAALRTGLAELLHEVDAGEPATGGGPTDRVPAGGPAGRREGPTSPGVARCA